MKQLIFALCLLATPVLAVQPDEILDDPALEERGAGNIVGITVPCLPE